MSKQNEDDSALAVARGSAVRCPIGLEGSHHLCSAGICTICQHFARSRPMTPEEREATDKFFLSFFPPNVPDQPRGK